MIHIPHFQESEMVLSVIFFYNVFYYVRFLSIFVILQFYTKLDDIMVEKI